MESEIEDIYSAYSCVKNINPEWNTILLAFRDV